MHRAEETLAVRLVLPILHDFPSLQNSLAIQFYLYHGKEAFRCRFLRAHGRVYRPHLPPIAILALAITRRVDLLLSALLGCQNGLRCRSVHVVLAFLSWLPAGGFLRQMQERPCVWADQRRPGPG